MRTFAKISRGIREHTREILERFDRVIQEEPWIHLPADYRANYLDELIPLLAELALTAPHDEELCRRMLHTAACHGETRLKQGLPDSILFEELYLLRQAVWSYVRDRQDRPAEQAEEAILHIDHALSLASKASLRGFHRPTYEERGEWPGVIDDLASDWRPPPQR